MNMNFIEWHFNDYPEKNELVIVKTIDSDIKVCEWDGNKWLDAECGWDWFNMGVACWARFNVPETTTQMPRYYKWPDIYDGHEESYVRPYERRPEDV